MPVTVGQLATLYNSTCWCSWACKIIPRGSQTQEIRNSTKFPKVVFLHPFLKTSSTCGTWPEQHIHISSVKGTSAFTRHFTRQSVLGAKCLMREVFLFETKWSLIRRIFTEDLDNCVINEWVNKIVMCPNFCLATRFVILKPIQVTPSLA